ncbi:Uncharacterised protein [Yersinia enterocolitica]|nr:Uncharacterised protein [Yersinia enterocolitica]
MYEERSNIFITVLNRTFGMIIILEFLAKSISHETAIKHNAFIPIKLPFEIIIIICPAHFLRLITTDYAHRAHN